MEFLSSALCLAVVMALLIANSNVAASAVAPQQNETEAMLALRDTLSIDTNEWPDRIRPCDWPGVTCRGYHITVINLSGLRTENRTIPPTLDPVIQLPRLRRFNASGFPLRTIPAKIGLLGSLEALDLQNSTSGGRIPQMLGDLVNLRSLRLSRNNLSGQIPSELGKLVKIVFLDLSHNNLTGRFPEFILNFSRLVSLNLLGNSFSGQIPSTIGKLSTLQHFSVGSNLLEGEIPSVLWSLTNITHLDLSHNSISGSLDPKIGRLSNLVYLNLERNNLSGSIPTEISNCTRLRVLKLDHNFMNGEIPRSIGRLKDLQTMFLSFNGFSGNLPPELTSLMNLKIVNLAFNGFYGPLPTSIQNMKSLLLFDVTNNFLNGSVPSTLMPKVKISRNCFHFVREQHMERSCVIFYRETDMLRSPSRHNNNIVSTMNEKKGVKNFAAIIGGSLGGVLLVLVLGVAVLCIQRHQTRNSKTNELGESTRQIGGGLTDMSRLGENFSYAQLLEATNKLDPSNMIRAGHSGDFYKGVLKQSGAAQVVVKRIDLNRVKKDFYVRELEVFGKASHTGLVPLLGHCLEMKDEKFLVYKYMPNGDLESVMLKKTGPNNAKDLLFNPLDWIARLKIAIGIAEALAYLHHECSPPIIHRDIKANSILLDDKFEVRLSSLSSAGSQDGDSQPGLVARLLAISHSWDQGDSGSSPTTCAHDVYCFGKVLMEIISGNITTIECNDTRAGECSWLDHALPLIDIHDKDNLPRIIDPYLIVDEDLLEEVWAVAVIAKACLNPRPSKRPTMRHVLKALENPRKVVRTDMLNDNAALRTSSHSSWNEAFGSWRSSNASQQQQYPGIIPGTLREEYLSSGNSKGRSCRRSNVRHGSSDIVSDHTQDGAP